MPYLLMRISIKGRKFSFVQAFALVLYYGVAKNLRAKRTGKALRCWCGRKLFKKCGTTFNIERGAVFGCGLDIEIGEHSAIGIHAVIPSDTIIGAEVMMGPNCYILARNHRFDRLDIPMKRQGYFEEKRTVIEDDVWIGRNVTMTPGRTIRKGTVIGACTVLTKDFPEYSIVAGNPSRLIGSRIPEKENQA